MLIRCPHCLSGYDLPGRLVGEATSGLRCARCRESWTLQADGAGRHRLPALLGRYDGREIVAEARSGRRGPLLEAAPRPFQRPDMARSPRRPWRTAASLAVGAAAMAAVMTGIGRKEGFVRLLPSSAPFFAAIGLPVNLRGLALGGMHGTVEPTGQADGSILTLDGQISNLRGTATDIPRLRFTVRDGARNTLYSWSAAAPKTRLEAGETIAFRNRLAAPPPDGRDFVVSFAD